MRCMIAKHCVATIYSQLNFLLGQKLAVNPGKKLSLPPYLCLTEWVQHYWCTPAPLNVNKVEPVTCTLELGHVGRQLITLHVFVPSWVESGCSLAGIKERDYPMFKAYVYVVKTYSYTIWKWSLLGRVSFRCWLNIEWWVAYPYMIF